MRRANWPPLPAEVTATLLKEQWKVSADEEDHRRRSIYLFARRNLRYPLFEVFDKPDTNASCPQRPRSTTAPQSLMLLNSAFSLEIARSLAGAALKDGAGEAAAIDIVYRRALSRPATATESRQASAFLAAQAKLIAAEGRPSDRLALPVPMPEKAEPIAAAAFVDFCLAALNSSEFIYVD